MPKIYSTKEPLDLDRLHLAKPINKNGAHFIKTLDVDDPIYFLAPKCFTKQGFVNHSKKIFCDFVFSNEDSDFLCWLESLEEKARTGIYENREKWFETPLDEHDIESSMTSPYKPYKSGKFFIVRANVPTALGKINIKVYDENEQEAYPETVKENTRVLAVFEFQGIRCGVRSFQFEIELKQLLIVEPEKLFEKCVIGKPASLAESKPRERINLENTDDIVNENASSESAIEKNSELLESEAEVETPFESNAADTELIAQENLESPDSALDTAIPAATEDLTIAVIDDLPFDDEPQQDEPPIRLKSRNDVYYKLYKETRQRAREAKREALANYLEAKRIKTTYLLNDVSDSDSDLE